MSGESPGKDFIDREFIVTREFNAPKALVFKAWTDEQQLAQWWGPRGFSNPVCRLDLRLGGEIYVVMRAPNGVDYPMGGAYREISEPDRLVFTTSALDEAGKPLFELLLSVTFVERDGKTAVTSKALVLSATDEAALYLPGHETGMALSLERLAILLPAESEIITTRIMNVPQEIAFRAWTEAAHLARWWGPKGFRNTFQIFEPKPGGEWVFVMHGPDGTDYPNRSVFVEVAKPERLVFDHLSDHWFRVTTTFEALGDKTRVTFCMRFEDATHRDCVLKFVVEANEQNFDRMEAEMATMITQST